jgi:hypothetical protein
MVCAPLERMNPNPKREAQKAEDAGLMAEPEASVPVAKPDARDEEGIETARGEGQTGEMDDEEPEPSTQREDVQPDAE